MNGEAHVNYSWSDAFIDKFKFQNSTWLMIWIQPDIKWSTFLTWGIKRDAGYSLYERNLPNNSLSRHRVHIYIRKEIGFYDLSKKNDVYVCFSHK